MRCDMAGNFRVDLQSAASLRTLVIVRPPENNYHSHVGYIRDIVHFGRRPLVKDIRSRRRKRYQ
jgi:hypothetical protein